MLLILGLTAALTWSAAPPADVAARASTPRVVALGDSLTSGEGIGAGRAYPAVLQQMLDEAGLDVDVVNAGIRGDTTTRAIPRLTRALDGDVRVLIVALGANDGMRGLAIGQLKANLGHIIETAQSRGIAVLLVGMETLPLRGWDYSVAFHLAYREVAKQYEVPLVPFLLTGVIGNRQLMQPDFTHPNEQGARAMAANIWPYLEPLVRARLSQ